MIRKLKQSYYFDEIFEEFIRYLMINDSVFCTCGCSDKRVVDLLHKFKSAVQDKGMKCTNVYHINDIKGNDKYTMYIEEKDKHGFILQKNIAEINYCIGPFGGCKVTLVDLATKKNYTVGHIVAEKAVLFANQLPNIQEME